MGPVSDGYFGLRTPWMHPPAPRGRAGATATDIVSVPRYETSRFRLGVLLLAFRSQYIHIRDDYISKSHYLYRNM